MTHLSRQRLKKLFLLFPRLNLTCYLPHKLFLGLCHHLEIIDIQPAIAPCQLTWKTIICSPLSLKILIWFIRIVMLVVKLLTLQLKMKNMMVHVCHYVMLHTAESIFVGNPNKKKQYRLKAGLQKFASWGSTAIAKELTQLHTLKCFELTLNNYHTMQDTKLLPPLCSSQRNALVRLKLVCAPMAAHKVHMWPRKKQLLQLSPWKLSVFNAQSLPTKDKMWPLVISLGLFYRLTTPILS
jgi:hypothetical protein